MKRPRNIPRGRLRKKSRAHSHVALLTDFGISDHYVGAVKGVILSVNPSVTIADITHEVQPRQVRQAGYLLWAAYRYFPQGTVFVAVVDPGVGTKRRILALRTAKYVFLAPDNMLLDFILSEEKVIEAVEVNTARSPYILSPASHTFHGRDIFAPVAAYLSAGISLGEVGKTIALHPAVSPFMDGNTAKSRTAEILHIDQFGNLITNIRPRESLPTSLVIDKFLVAAWTNIFFEAQERTPSMMIGSSGLVEVVVKNGSAEQMLKVKVGDKMTVTWK